MIFAVHQVCNDCKDHSNLCGTESCAWCPVRYRCKLGTMKPKTSNKFFCLYSLLVKLSHLMLCIDCVMIIHFHLFVHLDFKFMASILIPLSPIHRAHHFSGFLSVSFFYSFIVNFDKRPALYWANAIINFVFIFIPPNFNGILVIVEKR